jgi:hypothetical protein
LGRTSPNKLRRPGSRDRPPIAGAFEEVQRPASSHRLEFESKLETIGEPDNENDTAKTPKRPRRSSLSDLRSLLAAATLEDATPLPLQLTKQTSEKFNSAPRIPSPSRIPISPNSQGLRSPRQKENFSQSLNEGSATDSDQLKGHTKGLSTSNIPTLRRPNTAGGSGNESPSRPTSSPSKGAASSQKLRLQSPQKLRERLQTEKKAVDEVDASLKSELSKIAEDMARATSGLGSRTNTMDLRKVSGQVKALEDRIPQVIRDLSERHAAIQRDMEGTLRVTEMKVKAIDQLYREATAENELLYEKFNSELGKIVKALKGKGRDDKEELVGKLKEANEEAARAKKESARLRRELASLRSAMKGAGSTA